MSIEQHTGLISKNILVEGRRTSIRLEPEMWRALKDIAARESCTIHELCTLVSQCKRDCSTLTAAIRVFLMLYYRAATTEEGHIQAGHGDITRMRGRAPKKTISNANSNAPDPDNLNDDEEMTAPGTLHDHLQNRLYAA